VLGWCSSFTFLTLPLMNCSILLTVSFPSLLCRAPASVPAAADVARLQERMSYADTIAQLKERQNAQEITMSEILVRGGWGAGGGRWGWGGVEYYLRRLPCCPMEWRVGCNPVAALPSVCFVCRAHSRGISCHVFCHAWPHAGESEEAGNGGDALPEGVSSMLAPRYSGLVGWLGAVVWWLSALAWNWDVSLSAMCTPVTL
jgi:hypothetical protein